MPTPPVPPLPDEVQPPEHIIRFAIESACDSACRSKRGVAIFRGVDLLVSAFNYKTFGCDGSAECKATCRVDAVHAEQSALLACDSAKRRGADMLHVKVVGGLLVPSGGPSCVECSKLILSGGIRWMWLYQESGWTRFSASEFYRLSVAQYAEALARTCETCRFAGSPVEWSHPHLSRRNCGFLAGFTDDCVTVPLVDANGDPWKCAGYQAKEKTT